MRFANWPVLLLLLLIPLLHRWWMRRNQPPRIVFPLPVPANIGRKNPLLWVMILKYLALSLFIVALARPQTSYRQTDRTVNGVDIMMVMDISASMNIEDLSERSRLLVAKDTMEGFIKGRQNDRIGFIAFSGEPLTLAPPTLDYGLVLRSLQEVKIGDLKDGTAIGDGLSLAVGHLRNSKAKSRVIILLTDGDNNVGQVDPGTAGELALGYGIRVYTIAIGREGRVKLPIRQKTPLGNTVTTYQWFDNALNPELLEQIAKQTGGRFYRVTDESALLSVFKEVDQLEKTEVKTTEKVRYDEQFERPLKLGMLVAVAERFLAWGGFAGWGIFP
jgi:Ca-activated chloride channel family protein